MQEMDRQTDRQTDRRTGREHETYFGFLACFHIVETFGPSFSPPHHYNNPQTEGK